MQKCSSKKNETLQRNMVVNMDETAIYFANKQIRTVHPLGRNTVAIRGSESRNHRMTACITVASDGIKLPLFVIFKGQPMEKIEKIYLILFRTLCVIAANHKDEWINVK